MKRLIFGTVLLLSVSLLTFGGERIPLWNGKTPFAHGRTSNDIPTFEYYPAPKSENPAPAIVIFPGGGYGGLAVGHEGKQYAEFFQRQGFAAFVIRYRLGSACYRHPVMLTDAARSVRLVRANAGTYHINPARIGVIGSSAGGHLAATILTQFDAGNPKAADPIDRVSSRPDFGILCYPVITMGPGTHNGSRDNLLGRNPPYALVEKLSAEKQVKFNTPTCFIWHTSDDSTVNVTNSLKFATALREKRIPFELHVYPSGPHGMGLAKGRLPWTEDLVRYLNRILNRKR